MDGGGRQTLTQQGYDVVTRNGKNKRLFRSIHPHRAIH
jgi:hypothetical protein